MISALKRLVANNENNLNSASTNANSTNNSQANNATATSQANLANASGGSNATAVSLNSTSTSNLAATASLFNNGMHMISQTLQKKFSKGVHYNSKHYITQIKNVIKV
jgi:hypothetical protein